MKPRIVRLASSCFGPECWAVVFGVGVPCLRCASWQDALKFALKLRWRA